MSGEVIEPHMYDLRLVGYFPKRTGVPPNWSASAASAHVIEICSVSGCIAGEPDGWIDRWLHNELGFFNTPSDAELVVPAGWEGFTVFAYKLLPFQFDQGRMTELPIGSLPVEPLPSDFTSLGFDVPNKTFSAFFECSPLSCNGMADEIPVNRYCLVQRLEEAIGVAERFSREGPEPGTYYVLEVLAPRSV